MNRIRNLNDYNEFLDAGDAENARLKPYGRKNINGRVFIVDTNQALTQCRKFIDRILQEVKQKYTNEHGNITDTDFYRVLYELETRVKEEGYGLTQIEAICRVTLKNGKDWVYFRVNAQSIGMWPEDLM